MTEEITINKRDYDYWLDLPETKKFIAIWQEALDMTNDARLDKSLIKSQEGLLRANFLAGYSQAVEEMLTLGEIFENESSGV